MILEVECIEYFQLRHRGDDRLQGRERLIACADLVRRKESADTPDRRRLPSPTHSSRSRALSAVWRASSANAVTRLRQSRMSTRAWAWNGRLTRPACFMSSMYDFGVGMSVVFCRRAVRLYYPCSKRTEITRRILKNASYLRRTLSLEILSSPIVEFKRSTSLRSGRIGYLYTRCISYVLFSTLPDHL
jgi:hypothetical protein